MDIFDRALEKFGIEKQIIKLCEECAEMETAIMHFREGRDTSDHVAEEIADVTIVLEQIMRAFSITEKQLSEWLDFKLNRLEGRL